LRSQRPRIEPNQTPNTTRRGEGGRRRKGRWRRKRNKNLYYFYALLKFYMKLSHVFTFMSLFNIFFFFFCFEVFIVERQRQEE
jgi:hypothetical protein